MNIPSPNTSAFARPYVVSWNLTYRCNLACEHCYLDAGAAPLVSTENFADRSELGTEECFRVIDEIATFAPECLTILTGGEPLLRRDILEIVQRAAERELWVVVGTNGVLITENVAQRLAEAGARGLSLSLDALDPDRHDGFRKVRGAWRNTVEGAEILNRNFSVTASPRTYSTSWREIRRWLYDQRRLHSPSKVPVSTCRRLASGLT